MANKLNRIFILLYLLLLFQGCNSNYDLTGFVYSADGANSRFKQSKTWNKTHPFKNLVVSGEEYQILVAADSHIGGVNNFRTLLTEARKPENSAFVMVGDIVSGKKEDYLTFKNELPDFNEIPYFLMVGNHDLYFGGWETYYEYFGSSTYYFTIQTNSASDIFICLDSGSGTLGDKQMEWLKNVLSTERSNYRNCVVFSHVNFFRNRHTLSTNPLVSELYVLMDLFQKYDVNLVISGHDHERSFNYFEDTTYITLDALVDGIPNASFLKLYYRNGKLGYSFQAVN